MKRTTIAVLFCMPLTAIAAVGAARAHCDTLDGPVVKAAQQALETGRIEPVLAWVQATDETEIRAAFEQSRKVRELAPDARALADRYFFETLVRLHRAGEGAPYTGLKPAGQDLGPAIPAADKAVETGSSEAVETLLLDTVRAGLAERFKAIKGRSAPGKNVAAGRAWVGAYVPLVHYVEGVYRAAKVNGSAGREGGCGHPAPQDPHGHGDGESRE